MDFAGLKLCTFEVATHLGRHQRLGAAIDGCIADLNFATAWYMAQTNEPEPQRLADALVPANLAEFVRSGIRALHTAEELFLGSGPHPADWWKNGSPPRGPNDETLVYRPDEVRLCAPLPGRNTVGPDEEVRAAEFRPKLAVLCGVARIAGYTLMNDFGGVVALGPYLATIVDPKKLVMSVRVNGKETQRLDLRNVTQPCADLAPGDLRELGSADPIPANPGDVIELEVPAIGTLRNGIS